MGLFLGYRVNKKDAEPFSGHTCSAGAFSIYRKDIILKIGGWNQLLVKILCLRGICYLW